MADASAGKGRDKDEQPPRPTPKRTRNPEEWHKVKQKRLRIAGKEHISTTGKIISAKRPGEDCMCRRKCFQKIPEEVRLKTFEGFYNMKSHDEQNAYLFGLMRQIDVKRKRVKSSLRRTCTFEYFIRVRGRETQVCQTAFKNIHAITERKVRVLCKKMDDGVMFPSDNRGKTTNRAGEIRLPQETLNEIKFHIQMIVHSHKLKDFIRIDKATGLEINITKMWKDYIMTHDPKNMHATVSKIKNKENKTIQEENQTVQTPTIIQTSIPQEISGSQNTDNYCLSYTGTGNVINLTDNYITHTMVPAQYSSQHITMGNYIIPEKVPYFSQGQVVQQQIIRAPDPITASITAQQTFGHPETNMYLIVQAGEPSVQLIKDEQSQPIVDNSKDNKTKSFKRSKKPGPVVKLWRYVKIFHEEVYGPTLAAIKTRLPLYFNQSTSQKKAKKNSSKQTKSEQQICTTPTSQPNNVEQHQPQICQCQHLQQQCQHQCQSQQQQQQCQQQQAHQQCQQQQCTLQHQCQPQSQQTIVAPVPRNLFNTFSDDKL